MKKRLLTALIVALGVSSAFAYNVGDYIYTRNGKFKVVGQNLIGSDAITTMGGTPLNPDSIKTITDGDPDFVDSPNGQPYLMVAAGNIKVNCTALSEIPNKVTANFKAVVPVSGSTQYVAMYKVKSIDWSSSSTQYYTGRNANYQNIAFRTDTELDVTGITSYSNWATYTGNDGWVELAYDLITPEDGFLNFWFFNLASGDCFGDFGVYEVTPVGDDRMVNDFINEINTYLSLIPSVEGDETRAVLEGDILPMLNAYLENPDASASEVEETIAGLAAEDGPLADFINANTLDISSYFTNFTFNDVATGNKRLVPGWSVDAGTGQWGIAAATGTSYWNFKTVNVREENSADGKLGGGYYTQTVDLPKGKYLYTLKAQACNYFMSGKGKNDNRYIPDYFTPVEGLKYFINDNEVALNVPTDKAATFINVFDMPEDGDKKIGFYSPGNDITAGLKNNYMNTTGGGAYRFDNMQIRVIGVEKDYIDRYFYENAVAAARVALQEAITSAEADAASTTYCFGKTEINDAINAAKAELDANTAFSQECLTALNTAKDVLAAAVRAYKRVNVEYIQLGKDIDICKADLADETRPKGKEEFGAVITMAENYYKAQTADSRDSLMLVQTDSTLMDARVTYRFVNTSYATPSEVPMVNGTFSMKNATGWVVDGTTGNGAWKFQSNSDFTDGYCAYYNRGYTATDTKYIYQDVELPAAGVYEFYAEVICRNWNMGDATEEATTDMYIFAGEDSTEVYTMWNPEFTHSENPSQDYPGNVKAYTKVIKVEDLAALEEGKIRVGLTRKNEGATVYPNLIYIGSCHLYYYGSIADYETGISDVNTDKVTVNKGDIYSISGAKVRSNATSLSGLSKGIYIMNGKKYVVK